MPREWFEDPGPGEAPRAMAEAGGVPSPWLWQWPRQAQPSQRLLWAHSPECICYKTLFVVLFTGPVESPLCLSVACMYPNELDAQHGMDIDRQTEAEVWWKDSGQ